MSHEFLDELKEEALDFFEDLWEHVDQHRPARPYTPKTTSVNGVEVIVRPAYFFAERIDNSLKVIFGASIAVSALTATFLGFTRLSDLLEVLITSWWGRICMFVIGISYLLLAIWKLVHLESKDTKLTN